MFWRCARLGFFGRRLVGLVLDGSHHGEGEHDERDVTMPAVPGSGFVVVEPELVFGCLEAVLDRPAMALDADQGLDRGPCRTPGGEVGEIAVGDVLFRGTRWLSPKLGSWCMGIWRTAHCDTARQR